MQFIKARDGKRLVPVSSDEHANLIRESRGNPLSGRFGTGGCAIVAEDSPWAIGLLAMWRGEVEAEGSGI